MRRPAVGAGLLPGAGGREPGRRVAVPAPGGAGGGPGGAGSGGILPGRGPAYLVRHVCPVPYVGPGGAQSGGLDRRVLPDVFHGTAGAGVSGDSAVRRVRGVCAVHPVHCGCAALFAADARAAGWLAHRPVPALVLGHRPGMDGGQHGAGAVSVWPERRSLGRRFPRADRVYTAGPALCGAGFLGVGPAALPAGGRVPAPGAGGYGEYRPRTAGRTQQRGGGAAGRGEPPAGAAPGGQGRLPGEGARPAPADRQCLPRPPHPPDLHPGLSPASGGPRTDGGGAAGIPGGDCGAGQDAPEPDYQLL